MIFHRSFRSILFPLLLLTGLSACYLRPEIEGRQLVASTYDETADFPNLNTYVLLDSVVHITEFPGASYQFDPEVDAKILAEIDANIKRIGFTPAIDPGPDNLPDVVFLVSVLSTDNVGSFITYPNFNYWGWYPEWLEWGFAPSPSPFYPWGTSVTFQYSSGSLFIEMYDITRADFEEDIVPVAWLGAVNGLLEGTLADVQRRIQDDIRQVFDQSPYLHK